MHPSIPRSIMKHNMYMYKKHICYFKIISHQYINDCFLKQQQMKIMCPCLSAVIDSSKHSRLDTGIMIISCPIFDSSPYISPNFTQRDVSFLSSGGKPI